MLVIYFRTIKFQSISILTTPLFDKMKTTNVNNSHVEVGFDISQVTTHKNIYKSHNTKKC